MKITHITYAKVAHRQPVKPMTLRPHEAGVDDFLVDHLKDLRKRAASNVCPLAVFTSDEARAQFQALRAGTDQDFLTAAGQLTTSLIGQMDGRSADGLFVCLRAVDGQKVSGAALKLQVVTENAAKLEQVANGELSLSAVRDVLDAPGELQKGALVDDSRTGSEVIIGDRLTQDAAYFPRAFGIRTEQRSADTASDLVSAVHGHSESAARQLAMALPGIAPGSTTDVLTAAALTIPELTPDVIDVVSTELAGRVRPVNRVDTRAAIRAVITADGITITSGITAMDRIRIENDPTEGWRIIIGTDSQPSIEYRR